jgi:L-ascorbate metabolism protein UlaG (beta-lactamase superfamily)
MIKYIVGVVVLAAIVFGGYYLITNGNPTLETEQPMQSGTENTSVEIVPIEHATGIVRWGDTDIYFDPTGGPEAFAGQPAADIVLVTDIHGDHLSTSTIAAVLGSAPLIVPQAVKDLLPPDLQAKASVLANGQSFTDTNSFLITAVPMYNLPAAENKDRHVKGRGNGYLIEKDGMRVYIAGDTAGTPEMRALTDIDVALVPMNQTYTMSVEEAADAVLAFRPRTVLPYHYREPSGLADVAKFKQLVNAGDPLINVVLDAWYPETD